MNLGRRKFLEFGLTVLSSGLQVGSGFLLTKLVVHELDLDSAKAWFLMLAFIPFFILIDRGVGTIFLRSLNEIRSEADKSKYTEKFYGTLNYLHLLTVPVVLTAIFWMRESNFIKLKELYEVVFMTAAIIIKALSVAYATSLYSVLTNITEKNFKSVFAIFNLFINFIFLSFDTELIFLLVGVCIVSIFSIWATYVIVNKRFDTKNKIIFRILPYKFSSVEMDAIKTAIPALLIVYYMPFLISAKLNTQYNILFGFLQQVYFGLAITVMAVINIKYIRLVELNVEKKYSEARALLLRIASKTSFISGIVILTFGVCSKWLLLKVLGEAYVQYNEAFVMYIAVMSFEWIQTVFTRGVVASGKYNFLSRTIVSSAIIIIASNLLIGEYGIHVAWISLMIAQLPTCHFLNIREALQKYRISVNVFLKSISFYLFAIVALLVMQLC